MWFFMIACYLLMVLSFALLALTGIQGYAGFLFFGISHATLALLTAIIYLFTSTLLLFFFVGTGVSVKEYILEKRGGTPEHYQRCIEIKRIAYPPILWNLLWVSLLFIIGGAVHTHRLPTWTHGLLFWVAVLHWGHTIGIQHRCFKENTKIMLETFGVITK
jgi:hypothetical protein